jgi:hypothetical protein
MRSAILSRRSCVFVSLLGSIVVGIDFSISGVERVARLNEE